MFILVYNDELSFISTNRTLKNVLEKVLEKQCINRESKSSIS